jgi:hypothetical protein
MTTVPAMEQRRKTDKSILPKTIKNHRIMSIKGNTIVFEYNPKTSIKVYLWLGLAMFLVPLIIFIFLFFKEVRWNIINIGIVFLILSLWFWIKACVMKSRQKKEINITVSPKGVITPKGELIPIESIDHCFLKFCYDQMNVLIAVFFNIQLKSGKINSFKFNDYFVPFDWSVETFAEKANGKLGVRLFSRSETYHEPVSRVKGEVKE